ncbi:Coiled-coil domain-containing protein 50 [Eumeta japonica]|uniref:Coiled-coil domain-containing protein 50 n=1 Tax=Eumeta variegata TaxID=151549 RepID=A0A4C1TIB4_EUMVA|nr:Coiled-coil domain-containing protein 50 [Eumeta japonica]
MSSLQSSDTMPKLGHVTDLREQWLVRTDGVLAHRLQDREISSHLCENRYRNQQIREDFPVALNEQKGIERELRQREAARLRQADMDAEIAREMAEINLRRQRRQYSVDILQQPGCSRAPPSSLVPEFVTPLQSHIPDDIDPDALGLTPTELEEMRKRLEQEERDAKLARELSHESDDRDALLSDMKYAVEAQDGELAKLLQEREYKKLQRAKEKARQKALLKKQQRRAAQQQQSHLTVPSANEPQATLLDAYSNPRDLIIQNGFRLSKSVDSDLNYVEPFEKEHIQSKASALQSKEISKQWYMQQMDGTQQGSQNANMNCRDISTMNVHSFNITDEMKNMPSSQSIAAMQHRQPPPVPISIKKPRFPDPVSIRPASHYPTDESVSSCEIPPTFNNYSENNNLYSSTYPPDHSNNGLQDHIMDASKRLSVISDITVENLSRKKKKQADLSKKKKGCKIQ